MNPTNDDIIAALREADGVAAYAAKLLGCSRYTVQNRITHNPSLRAERDRLRAAAGPLSRNRTASERLRVPPGHCPRCGLGYRHAPEVRGVCCWCAMDIRRRGGNLKDSQIAILPIDSVI
jgi:hypothetical protein